jgi:hypothetical protein
MLNLTLPFVISLTGFLCCRLRSCVVDRQRFNANPYPDPTLCFDANPDPTYKQGQIKLENFQCT